jgi:hypothetical protein
MPVYNRFNFSGSKPFPSDFNDVVGPSMQILEGLRTKPKETVNMLIDYSFGRRGDLKA